MGLGGLTLNPWVPELWFRLRALILGSCEVFVFEYGVLAPRFRAQGLGF